MVIITVIMYVTICKKNVKLNLLRCLVNVYSKSKACSQILQLRSILNLSIYISYINTIKNLSHETANIVKTLIKKEVNQEYIRLKNILIVGQS
jgi:hypothetical protein